MEKDVEHRWRGALSREVVKPEMHPVRLMGWIVGWIVLPPSFYVEVLMPGVSEGDLIGK